MLDRPPKVVIPSALEQAETEVGVRHRPRPWVLIHGDQLQRAALDVDATLLVARDVAAQAVRVGRSQVDERLPERQPVARLRLQLADSALEQVDYPVEVVLALFAVE